MVVFFLILLRDVVEHLISEGHIYSTIDDNHYKSAANG